MAGNLWTIFVTTSIHRVLEHYDITDFKHCRLTGMYEGRPCRIVTYSQLPKRITGLNFDRVFWHGRMPNQREREWVELRIKEEST